MPGQQSAGTTVSEGRIRHKRSRAACQECRIRKIRCDVVERGVPCSNCSAQPGVTCAIRRRKGSKSQSEQSPPDEHDQRLQERCHSFQAIEPAPPRPGNGPSFRVETPIQVQPTALSTIDDQPSWNGIGEIPSWNEDDAFTAPQLTTDPGSASTGIDFSHLLDIDDIFAFTRETALPGYTGVDNGDPWSGTYVQQYLSPSSVRNSANEYETSETDRTPSIHVPGLSSSEEQYLQREGCLQLPPTGVLRQMIWSYFYMVHPNLPVVAEDQVWALWEGEAFRLGSFSFLLMRAMIFAATNFVELDVLRAIGLSSKRDARISFYKKAKMFFDMGIERDPIALAQSCLLLTYYAPTYNSLRVNSFWLRTAIHYAQIAGANRHHRVRGPDTAKSSLLKRIWWGVILRDRILSLGLRRTVQLELSPSWSDHSSVPNAGDFDMEIGRSAVHSVDAQHRIIEVIATTCRLMQHLTDAIDLYRHEGLEERLEHAENSLAASVSHIQRALSKLRAWYDQAIADFPFPIGLDDADETPTICIYANMMFCYYSSAVFALNQHLILLAEMFPNARTMFSVDQARESLETSNKDVGQRIQEFLQVRLVKYLPISASAFIAIPLVLQAINVAAVRGAKTEAIENRRLQIFTRTLQAQQDNFDGSDFCADVLSNIVAYALKDEKFQSSMANWRDGRNGSANDSSSVSSSGQGKVKLDWNNLVYRRPRLFLRLMLYLDYALCTGGPPLEEDFPLVLRESAA